MVKVISIANQKGGVGKTTSSINIGSYLANQGNKVLLIDTDTQANLSYITTDIVNLMEEELPTMKEVLLGESTIDETLINLSDYSDNLYLAPATLTLSDAEITIIGSTMRETILARAIKNTETQFDYIIIDCPPSGGILTINALSASDYLIMPLQTDYLAYVGISLLLGTVKNVQTFINPNLKVLGYFFTMEEHTLHSKDVVHQANSELGISINNLGSISRATAIKDSSIAGSDIYTYAPKSKVAQQYAELVKNIEKEIG